MKPAISVILSTYNRCNMLPVMLNSLLKQTFRDFELVLVDNGSTDDTAEVCRRFAEENAFVRFFSISPNRGAAAGKRFGVDHALGDYFIMIADDDYCKPDMLEVLFNMAAKKKADIAVVGCQNDFGDRIEDFYVYEGEYVLHGTEGLSAFLERKLYNTNPDTKLFHRKLFEGLEWPAEKLRIDDIHFVYKLFAKADTVVCCGKPLYIKRKHGENMTAFLTGQLLTPAILKEYLHMQDNRVEYISKHVPELTEQVKYARASYMISMIERIQNGLAQSCEGILEDMTIFLRENSNDLINTQWVTERERNLMERYVLI